MREVVRREEMAQRAATRLGLAIRVTNHPSTDMEYIQMASTAQDLYQQNVSNLLDQLINHHCALMRCAQFGGHLQLNPNDTVQLKITENGKDLIERQFDLRDRHVMERLRATIQSMQEILPAASALSPNGGAA